MGGRSPSQGLEDLGDQFAEHQYGKAIAALRRSLAGSKQDPVIALMSCIILVAFDSLRGWFESAILHLSNGLRILYDFNNKRLNDNRMVVENLLPIFRRLSIQAYVILLSSSLNMIRTKVCQF